MSNKIIGLLICLLFILNCFPVKAEIYPTQSVTYKNCYIVSSGTMVNRLVIGLFKIGNKALIVYMNIGFKEDGNTSIYDEENGKLLWHQEGEHTVIVFFYRGNYSFIKDPEDGSIFVALDGLTIITRI
ncbi:MAG: hypothetical protein QHH15_05210 [Candidatus Thermoplasmatota archaeon]|jgi:outer membrane protein assembly factor BamB|nr:hypothetical protein [Candidatus Thermoplasmatota archaeon]